MYQAGCRYRFFIHRNCTIRALTTGILIANVPATVMITANMQIVVILVADIQAANMLAASKSKVPIDKNRLLSDF